MFHSRPLSALIDNLLYDFCLSKAYILVVVFKLCQDKNTSNKIQYLSSVFTLIHPILFLNKIPLYFVLYLDTETVNAHVGTFYRTSDREEISFCQNYKKFLYEIQFVLYRVIQIA